VLHLRGLGRGLAERDLLHAHARHVTRVLVPWSPIHRMHIMKKLGRSPRATSVTVDDVLGLGDHLTRLHVGPALILSPRHPLGRSLVLTTGLEGGGGIVHHLGGPWPLTIVLLGLRHDVVRHAHVLRVVWDRVHVTLVRQHPSVGPHGGVEVVRGPCHALLRPLAPRLVGGEPLTRGLLGRVAGARALLALVGVGVGIGHPQHGVTLTKHQEGGGVQKVASAATSPTDSFT